MVTKINLHIDAQQCYDFFTDVAEEVVLIRSNFLCLALVQNISLVYSIHILNEKQIDFRQSSKVKSVYNGITLMISTFRRTSHATYNIRFIDLASENLNELDPLSMYNINLKRNILFII